MTRLTEILLANIFITFCQSRLIPDYDDYVWRTGNN